MRESNFAFPAQNKACVCITSQLYDRRALDTTSPLPLFNSLTHLTYLTSTSPRIREIMTMDGGLERLVRILHDFCMCPPPPDNPTVLYGLMPPNARPAKLAPVLNPHSFDKHAAYRFSLAFQCVVNIGVRGSEPIRSRVVQAGTLDVVGCILEAWLANKGFAVGPSSSVTGIPRETREQRQARRTAQVAQRQREEAAQLASALQRQITMDQLQQRAQRDSVRPHRRLGRAPAADEYTQEDDSMDISSTDLSVQVVLLSDSTPRPSTSHSNSDTDVSTDVSTDASTTATPLGTGTPTGTVIVPSRDRSGTVIARPIWDPVIPPPTTNDTVAGTRPRNRRRRSLTSPVPSTDTSRPDTETEDDGDGDIDMDGADDSRMDDSDNPSFSASPSPTPHPPPRRMLTLGRRAVGIVSDDPTAGGPHGEALQVGGLDADARIIINDAGGVGEGVEVGVGVEDGIVSLEPNDDFAMGAPPGAPGALDEGAPAAAARAMNLNVGVEPTGRRRHAGDAPDATPRAGVVGLPATTAVSPTGRTTGHHHGHTHQTPGHGHHRTGTVRGRAATVDAGTPATTPAPAASLTTGSGRSHHHHRDSDSGPYRDEDVLLSLQLLAYLSKYPHVRQAFYKSRVTFHPASANLPGARYGVGTQAPPVPLSTKQKEKEKEKATAAAAVTSSSSSAAAASSSAAPSPPTQVAKDFFRNFTGGARGKERAREQAAPGSSSSAVGSAPAGTTTVRQTNVFSLVERFTFKPSSTETDLPNPPPRLPPEIQYWAGVIMRNACRKDESRGGIRQCANMLCGRWEAYPREFAKCRRCRKAKYCGKECQSTAWSEGHRFWCSAKDADDDMAAEPPSHHTHNHHSQQQQQPEGGDSGIHINVDTSADADGNVPISYGGARRIERREARERAEVQAVDMDEDGDADTATVRGFRAAGMAGAHPTAVNAAFGASPAGVRAEGSTARERSAYQQQGSPSRVRASEMRRRHGSEGTETAYASSPGAPRRGADTSSASPTAVIPGMVTETLSPQRHLTARNSDDWLSGVLPRTEAGPSRRMRRAELNATAFIPPPSSSEDNDMILG